MKVDSTPQLEEDDEFEEFDTEGPAAALFNLRLASAVCSSAVVP